MENKKSTETQILEAAKRVFVQKGYDGARMQEIADEAKINKSMLHYYFRSKEVLFNKIIDDTVDVLIPRFIEALSGDDGVMVKVERLVERQIDGIMENPHMPMFMLNELAQNRMHVSHKMKARFAEKNTFTKFIKEIKQEQNDGIIKQVAPEHFILTLMSLIMFPFIARPIFQNMLEIPDEMYRQMIVDRKRIIVDIIKKSFLLKPE